MEVYLVEVHKIWLEKYFDGYLLSQESVSFFRVFYGIAEWINS